jgi:glucose-1-phosphate thymidylyltransferase
MKGVILAGGLGTRLYPLTWATNKHLLPIYDKPMIFYPIETLVKAGIKDVLVVSSGPHAGHFLRVLKNGEELGLNHLEYAFQEKPDGGIADALALAKDFADNGPITVVLGDNTTDADISAEIKSYKDGAMIFLKKVKDPERYGVPEFNSKNEIITIEEKPKVAKSSYAVTGLYVYDSDVFDVIKKIKPSERGQLEITDVNNAYLKKNKLVWKDLNGFWTDAGTYASLYKANKFWAEKRGYNDESV